MPHKRCPLKFKLTSDLAREIGDEYAVIFMTACGAKAPNGAPVVPKPGPRFEELLGLLEVVLESC